MQVFKYGLLRNIIPVTGGPSFPDNILTVNERCTLHHMLSSSMDKWERGDEYLVCPLADPQRQVNSDQFTGSVKSSCPIEKGVVLTDFGTVSPNHVLLAIASWLQPQEVRQMRMLDGYSRKRSPPLYFPYNKTVNNFWAATIAGDMAELIVFQLPLSSTPQFGPGGWWNDVILPTRFYQKIDYQGVLHDFWQDTDAELLGGIDGSMIGHQVSDWNFLSGSLRLSQVLEMFYSTRGGQFPNQRRACNRRDFNVGTLAKSRGIIEQQVTNFAELLSTNSISFLMDATFISKNRVNTFNAYKDYVNRLVAKYPPCPDNSGYFEAKVRLNVVFDATWDPYTTIQILTKLGVILDVSKYGSTISVINGISGDVVVSEAATVGDLYLNWILANETLKEVKATDMTKGFLRLKKIVESAEFRRKKSEPAADVTLVLAKTTLLTDASFDRINSTLDAIKSESPEMRFVYLIRTQDSRPWVKLTSLQYSQDDRIVTMDNDDLQNLYTNLEFLQDMPSHIIPPLCSDMKFNEKVLFSTEQYVTPGESRNYMLHPAYFCSSTYVNIELENFNYGDIMLCFSRSPLEVTRSPQCTSIGNFEKFKFQLENPCSSKVTTGPHEEWDANCRPIYMRVIALKSTSSCTEKDCRFTDQIRFNFNVGGIACRREFGVPCFATAIVSQLHLFVTMTALAMIFSY
ncbi:hypothetical protein GE061_011945 [Apolygus lucorum]|uniref:Uncharacterized protein n=1 Tax=Apolygus lucorum TaxID=248454 RepID=A0A8S9XR63_APOLU|nr:hypothetical protein GE061_011945 [Apolygus lucorum]